MTNLKVSLASAFTNIEALVSGLGHSIISSYRQVYTSSEWAH